MRFVVWAMMAVFIFGGYNTWGKANKAKQKTTKSAKAAKSAHGKKPTAKKNAKAKKNADAVKTEENREPASAEPESNNSTNDSDLVTDDEILNGEAQVD